MTREKHAISDAAVREKTGKSRDAWFRLLDDAGAADLPHPDIVKRLRGELGLRNHWWAQTICVEYERARGRRVVGQTADAGFQVGVQRRFDLTPKQAWDLITKPAGRKAWLGEVPRMRFEPGRPYETREGTTGEIRTMKEGEHLRLTWRPKGFAAPTTLQVRVVPQGERTAITFHHEKLPDAEARERMRGHWTAVLDRLEALVAKK